MQEKFRKCDKINFRLKHFNPLDPNTYAIISSDPRHRIFSPFEASSQGETSLLQKFPPSLSLSLPSDVSWYTKVKRTGQEGHLKLPYVTTLFPPRTSCINSAFGRMCSGNPRNISHPRPRFLVKVICCTPYGFEKKGGQAERKWVPRETLHHWNFYLLSEGICDRCEKKNWILFNPVSNFPNDTEKFFIQLISNFPIFPLDVNNN